MFPRTVQLTSELEHKVDDLWGNTQARASLSCPIGLTVGDGLGVRNDAGVIDLASPGPILYNLEIRVPGCSIERIKDTVEGRASLAISKELLPKEMETQLTTSLTSPQERPTAEKRIARGVFGRRRRNKACVHRRSPGMKGRFRAT